MKFFFIISWPGLPAIRPALDPLSISEAMSTCTLLKTSLHGLMDKSTDLDIGPRGYKNLSCSTQLGMKKCS